MHSIKQEKAVRGSMLSSENFKSPANSTDLSNTSHPLLKETHSGLRPLEQELFSLFSSKESSLKIARGLPRLYHQKNPSQTRIKDGFSKLPSLKTKAVERFLLPLYQMIELPKNTRIILLNNNTHPEDLTTAKEAIRILRKHFTQSHILWIALMPQHVSCTTESHNTTKPTVSIDYHQECLLSDISQNAIDLLKSSDLILFFPSLFAEIDQLLSLIQTAKHPPQTLFIGKSGALESSFIQPEKADYSMGLHFLEYGICISTPPCDANFHQIRNQEVLQSLFNTTTPSPKNIEDYQTSHHFYLADLFSEIGGKIYLYALIQLESIFHQDIDICTPDIGWIVPLIQSKEKFFEKQLRIKRIQIHYHGQIYTKTFKKEGKTIRILAPEDLEEEDFLTLLHLSRDFVGVKDSSLSQAISSNKVFFYDGAFHFRPLMKDLVALAENRIAHYPGALLLFRFMKEAHLLSQGVDSKTEWVDELYFQKLKSYEEIGKMIAIAVKHPTAKEGFNQFNQLIKDEYAFNHNLCLIMQKKLSHHFFPDLASFEKSQKKTFQEGLISVKELINNITSGLFLKSIATPPRPSKILNKENSPH